VPRHTVEEGGGASAEGKESTSLCWPPGALERMRMNSSSFFLRRGKRAGRWAAGGLLLGRLLVAWWAVQWPGKPGKVSLLSLFVFCFLFFFPFLILLI
jgi:hypothetical protein